MTLRTARLLAALFLVLMLVAVTWPGMLPFARIRPLVLGLPFGLAWIAGWVTASVFVLWGLHRVEQRHRGEDA